MTLALLASPSLEPLTLDEVKAHLRLSSDHEDNLLAATLKAAREFTEFSSHQKLMTQSWRQYEICLPVSRCIALRVSPVQNVLQVTAFDRDGNPSVVPGEQYQLLRGTELPVLQLSGSVDPSIAANGLEIDLSVGFGDLGVDVPSGLQRAILLLISHWYEFRGAVSPNDQPVSLPAGFEALIAPHKPVRL